MYLFLSVLPVFLICLFIYLKDKQKEPLKLLFKLLLFGVVSCFPASFLELLIGSFFPLESSMDLITLFFYVFIGIAFVEELCKLFMVYFGSFNHSEFNNLYDMIIYATFVSLGFALFENILYIYDDSHVFVGILRALFAVPGHACYGIIMGYYLGIAKISLINNNEVLHRKNLILSLFVPTVMHTLYDFCLLSGSVLLILLCFLYVIFVYIVCLKKVFHISRNAKDFKSFYCTKCGTKVSGRFCIVCGNENK